MVSGLYSNLLVIIITLDFKKHWRWRKTETSREELQGVTFFFIVTLCGESMRSTETTPFIVIEQKSIFFGGAINPGAEQIQTTLPIKYSSCFLLKL